VGFGNTGSTGLLLEAVPTGRIITAMVVWSEIGIVGYLLGPVAGGAVAQALGFSWLVLVPAVAGVLVLAVIARARRVPA
jgi:MFS family permease